MSKWAIISLRLQRFVIFYESLNVVFYKKNVTFNNYLIRLKIQHEKTTTINIFTLSIYFGS